MVPDKPEITQENINNLKILQHHNAGASASHRQPNDITNPEDVLVASKRDTPDVSGNIKDMSFDNFLQMLYHKLVQ